MNKIITLNDEPGNVVEFDYLDLIEFESNEYVALLPTDDLEDIGEVINLHIEDPDEDAE